MLPTMEIELTISVDPGQLRTLSKDEIDDGWTLNREYESLDYATWDDAHAALELERELIVTADASASTWLEFEERCDEFDSDDDLILSQYFTVDIGCGALVLALNAAGFRTAYSCRGHPEAKRHGGGARFPCILVASDQARWEQLEPLLRASNCGAEIREGALLLLAHSVTAFLTLADVLLASKAVFVGLGPMAVCDEEVT